MSIFKLFPDIGLSERWEWKTDILSSYVNTEQRISLRERPRITQSAVFGNLDQDANRSIFMDVMNNIKTVFDTPLWAYNTKITQSSSSGVTRIYFDSAFCPVSAGGIVILMNIRSGIFYSHYVSTVYADGCDLSSVLTGDISTSFTVVLGFKSIIHQEASFVTKTILSNASVTFSSWIEPTIVRPFSNVSISEFDSLPVLEKIIRMGSTQKVDFKRFITDNGISLRNISSGWDVAILQKTLSFLVKRVSDSEDLDYWRQFISDTKGAQKAFLLSTNMEDFSLYEDLTQDGSSLKVDLTDYTSLLFPYEAFKKIKITYSDNSFSYHTVSSSVDDSEYTTLSVTPNIPDDPKVTDVLRISYLLKGRMGDTITFRHNNLDSDLSINFSTVN